MAVHALKGALERLLDRPEARLPLPAPKIGAVIGADQPYDPYGSRLDEARLR